MRLRRLSLLIAVFTLASVLSGCAGLMGGLRRDLDDAQAYSSAPTTGGSWTERGLLSENGEDSPYADRLDSIGHSDRGPASLSYPGSGENGSWVGGEQAEAAARDYRRYREEGEEAAAKYSDARNRIPSAEARSRYKNGQRATRADFIDEASNESSLWASDGQTNYYFTKNKIRGVGDIVSVNLEAGLVKDVSYEIARTLTETEREQELELAQERIRAKAMGLPDPDAKAGTDQVATSSASSSRAPAAGEESKADETATVRQATLADIDVSRSIDLKAGDTIMSEIIERYPNGNYKIRGTKKVPYRGGYRIMTMLGIVKGTDIGEDDTVASGKLYEYRLEALR